MFRFREAHRDRPSPGQEGEAILHGLRQPHLRGEDVARAVGDHQETGRRPRETVDHLVHGAVAPDGDDGLHPGMGGLAAQGESEARRQHGARFYQLVQHMQRSFSCLEQCRIPVLAAIQGGCIGGGVDLVTACDIRLCSADTVFSVRETKLAMVADVGTMQRLPRIVDPGAEIGRAHV